MANISNITMWANEYYGATKSESRIKDLKKELKAKMVGALEALGISVLELPNGLKVRLDPKESEEFDREAFKADYPELYAKYSRLKKSEAFSVKGTPKR